jgi:hypothetical protein
MTSVHGNGKDQKNENYENMFLLKSKSDLSLSPHSHCIMYVATVREFYWAHSVVENARRRLVPITITNNV